MKTNIIDIPHQPAKRRAIKVSAAILAGMFWLGTQPALQAQPNFTRITTGPLGTDLGSSGGAVGDYNGDGYVDIFIGRYRAGRSALYHNNGDGTFRSITNNNFPLPVGPYFFGTCSDFDNDGRVDVFQIVLSSPPSPILYNNGDGTFAPVTLAPLNPWWQSSIDFDHDGLLDLYFTALDTNGGNSNRLYRNLGGRRFQAMTSAEVGAILGPATFGNAAFADYDDDGWEDLALPDLIFSRRLFLFRRDSAGRFISVTNELTMATTRPLVASWGDYDNDGRVDLFLAGGINTLYRNLGDGNFAQVSIGLTIQGFWNGASWGDYDNDGFLDLFMTYGNNTGNALFRNNGNGTFTRNTDSPIYTDSPAPGGSYAGIWFDYDNDGFLDVFVPNGNDGGTAFAQNFLYHNHGNANAWLKVKLVGTLSNREGAGAKVRVQANFAGATRWLRRDITSGGDPYNGSGPIAHFGLGDATKVETLRVEWPSGQVTESNCVPVRQFITLTEPPGLRAIRLNQGTMQMQLTAHTGMNVGMEVSSNLVDWASWQTVPQTNRTTPVTDAEAGQHPRRFYKARVQ